MPGPGGTGAPDFLVIGAGVVGLTLALELRRRHPGAAIVVQDKEPGAGRHASGRNSGVLHAGFYYSEDSLKARFTREGNLAWQEFCREQGLPLRVTGKVVVARSEDELPSLEVLFQRARANGVPVERVSPEALRSLEPRARTVGAALFSPSTASVDPGACVARLAELARERGVALEYGSPFDPRREAGFVFNAAGIHADRVARAFGFGDGFTMLPFRGMYLKGRNDAPGLARHVYPVPDLRQPFLGTHFTVTVEGGLKIGPTATPALGREHYGGWRSLRWDEAREILGWEARLFLGDVDGFRALARAEVLKRLRPYLVAQAGRLVEGVRLDDFRQWGTPGIRAQLFDTRTRRLVMDFLFQGDARSLHVLNAVSPAFTCAFPFASFLVDRAEALAA